MDDVEGLSKSCLRESAEPIISDSKQYKSRNVRRGAFILTTCAFITWAISMSAVLTGTIAASCYIAGNHSKLKALLEGKGHNAPVVIAPNQATFKTRRLTKEVPFGFFLKDFDKDGDVDLVGYVPDYSDTTSVSRRPVLLFENQQYSSEK